MLRTVPLSSSPSLCTPLPFFFSLSLLSFSPLPSHSLLLCLSPPPPSPYVSLSCVHSLSVSLHSLNVNDIQDTCQKNSAAALAVGRRDLAKVQIVTT